MSKQTPEEVVDLLSRDMQYTLGCMAEWDDKSVIGYTLDNLPFGTRSLLQAYEAIEESGEFGYTFRFTQFGREVAQTCFERHEGYIHYEWNELEQAKARRAAAKLPQPLQETLGLLVSSSSDDIETFIILMPRADRELLKEHDIIDTDLDAPLDDPVWVILTEPGRRVANACAYLRLPEEAKQRLKEFDEARRQYWEGRFKNPLSIKAVPARRRRK